MDPIDNALDEAELALAAGRGLRGTGFWKAVAAAKRDPASADLDRIASIDRSAFEQWALLTVPIRVGTTLAVLATALGLFLIGLAYGTVPGRDWLFLVGALVVWVTTHGLGHLMVGKAVGMRFTYWFIGTITLPQPGVKVDYATYLRTPPRQRAWMHASGAIVSKVVPFLLLPSAVVSDVAGWVPVVLAGFGVLGVITDIVWSTKVSDWKKFRREMALVAVD